MEIAICSDIHVPEQESGIPTAFREQIRAADHVIHAGDFGSLDAHATVRDLAPELTAVYGNADPADIDLPTVASASLGGITFVVIHGIVNPVERVVSNAEGVVTSRDDWLNAVTATARARAAVEADTDTATPDRPLVGIGGHTHEVEDTVHDEIRVLNPGSATGVGEGVSQTMLTATVAGGELDVTHHEL